MLPSINALADAFCLCDSWYWEVRGTDPDPTGCTCTRRAPSATCTTWSPDVRRADDYNNLQDAGCTWATSGDFDQNEVLEFYSRCSSDCQFQAVRKDFAADVKSGSSERIRSSFRGSSTARISWPTRSTHHRMPGMATISSPTSTTRSSNPDVWMKSALIVTYDEHGGLTTSLPRRKASPIRDGINSPPPGRHRVLGASSPSIASACACPAVIASPWVAKGLVDSTAYQHTSVLATLKNLFGLPKFLTEARCPRPPFDGLFQKASKARTDTPATLPRVALLVITGSEVATGAPGQPTARTQREENSFAGSTT